MTTIAQIHEELVAHGIAHTYAQVIDKININDKEYERTIMISNKSHEPDIFVYIAKSRKKNWNDKQTKEQNSECGRERNRFISQLNPLLAQNLSGKLDFQFPEFKKSELAQKFEGKSLSNQYTTGPNTSGADSTLGNPDFSGNGDVSDFDIINNI